MGVFTGIYAPQFSEQMKWIADAFISLIKALVFPVVFFTIVLGIAGAGSAKKLGRVSLKAFLYFELVSTLALVVGLGVGNWLQPGKGLNVNPADLDNMWAEKYSHPEVHESVIYRVLHSSPMMQILILAILVGFLLFHFDQKRRTQPWLEKGTFFLFGWIRRAMFLAPLGAGCAMAYTVGRFGLASLRPLLSLMLCFYATCALFIFCVLGLISKKVGFSLFQFLRYMGDELVTVLGTSSSESGLGSLMEKLEKLGCSRSVVGIVVPAGYSFNLDGTNIYLTLSLLFITQAMNVHLSWVQQIMIMGVAMITSKGSAGVTGAGFVTLAATLAVVPEVPIAGLALILGVDRFMSEARALTNYIGNGVAALAISKWENELDEKTLQAELKLN